MMVPRSNMRSHVSDECELRLAPCELCSKMVISDFSAIYCSLLLLSKVIWKDHKRHQENDCPLKQVLCTNGCGYQTQRKALPAHLASSCPLRHIEVFASCAEHDSLTAIFFTVCSLCYSGVRSRPPGPPAGSVISARNSLRCVFRAMPRDDYSLPNGC